MDYSEYTDSSTEVAEKLVTVSDGVSLRVIDFRPENDSDERPVLLFVAGWISTIAGWKDVLRVVTPCFRTIYFESREKSSSVIPKGEKVSYAVERLSLDLKEVVEQMVPEKRNFVMAGSSLGATVIMEYLSMKLRQPECSILVSPLPEFRFPKLLAAIILNLVHPSFYFAVKPVVKWYLRNFRLDPVNEQEQVRKYEYTLDMADPYKLKANAKAVMNYSIWDRISDIPSPILIIGASTDALHETDTQKRMMDLFRKSEYMELESNRETHSKKAGEIMVDYIENRKYTRI